MSTDSLPPRSGDPPPRTTRHPRWLDHLSHLVWSPRSPLRRLEQNSRPLFVLLVVLALPLIPLLALALTPFAILFRVSRDIGRVLHRLVSGRRWVQTVNALGVAALQIPFAFILLTAGHIFLRIVLAVTQSEFLASAHPQVVHVLHYLFFLVGLLLILMIGFGATYGHDNEQPESINLDAAYVQAEAIQRAEATNENIHGLFRHPEGLRIKRGLARLLTPGRMVFLLNMNLCSLLQLGSLVLHEAHALWGPKVFANVPADTSLLACLVYVLDNALQAVPGDISQLLGLSLSPLEPAVPLGTLLVVTMNVALTWATVTFLYGWVRRISAGAPPARPSSGGADGVSTPPLPTWIDDTLLWDSGLHSLNGGNYKEAQRRFTKAIELEPLCRHYYGARGLTSYLLRELEASVVDLDTAIAMMPDDMESVLLRGKVHHDRGAYEAAIHDFTRVIQQNAEDGEAHLWLGRAALGSGDATAAVASLERALSLTTDPGSVYAWLALALVDQGRHSEATRRLAEACERVPPEQMDWFTMSRGYASLGDVVAAAEALGRTSMDRGELVRRIEADPHLRAVSEALLSRIKGDRDPRPS